MFIIAVYIMEWINFQDKWKRKKVMHINTKNEPIN